MRAVESADGGEALAAVLTQDQGAIGLENAIGIFRVHDQVGEIKRAPDHPLALVALVPGLPAVVGDEERAVGRFDEGINPLRIGGRDRDREPAVGFLRETFVRFRSDFLPGRAAVGRAEKSAARRVVRRFAAGAISPALAPKIPEPGEKNVRVGRIHRDGRGAGREIGTFQNEVPGLAAVGRFVEAAIGRIAPERARHRRVNRVAAFRTNDDLRNAFRVGQTRFVPGLAAVGRFVDAVADRDAVARPSGSPVPTQTFFEFFGSSAIAPIDCTGCSSKTGR